MAELVDAHVSGACIERCAGSSPVPGTKEKTFFKVFFLCLSQPLLYCRCLPLFGDSTGPVVGRADAIAPGTKEKTFFKVFFCALHSPYVVFMSAARVAS